MPITNILYLSLVLNILNCKKVDAVPVLGILSFGLDVCYFLDSVLLDNEPQSTSETFDYDGIENRISERIEMSTATTIFGIKIQAYISELRNVAITVKQLLEEMESIIKAKTNHTREECMRRFRDNFGIHKTEIYKIKLLLTFKVDVSDISSTLISLVANEVACSRPSLYEFEKYYMTLVSDVVAIALLNEKLSETNLYNETLASWRSAIQSLFSDFEKQKTECIENSFGHVKNLLESIDDSKELFENYQRNYLYQVNDVLYLGGNYCLLTLKAYNNILKKVKGNAETVVVINDEENLLSNGTKQLQKITSTIKFQNCKYDTGKIISFFDKLGVDLVFWLMYPQSQEFRFRILLDKNTTASMITTELDNMNYTIVVYIRIQERGIRSLVTPDDFEVNLYNEPPLPSEPELHQWKRVAAAIGGCFSLLLMIAICICIYFRYRRYRRYRRYLRDRRDGRDRQDRFQMVLLHAFTVEHNVYDVQDLREA